MELWNFHFSCSSDMQLPYVHMYSCFQPADMDQFTLWHWDRQCPFTSFLLKSFTGGGHEEDTFSSKLPHEYDCFFSTSAQNREKKNFHKHTNSHLHRDESGCKWAKRCVLESGPSAVLRNEQATPRGISKYVEHVSHFGSSKNDGSIQMQRPQHK